MYFHPKVADFPFTHTRSSRIFLAIGIPLFFCFFLLLFPMQCAFLPPTYCFDKIDTSIRSSFRHKLTHLHLKIGSRFFFSGVITIESWISVVLFSRYTFEDRDQSMTLEAIPLERSFIDYWHVNNCYVLDIFNVLIVRGFPDLILRIKREEIRINLNIEFLKLTILWYRAQRQARCARSFNEFLSRYRITNVQNT